MSYFPMCIQYSDSDKAEIVETMHDIQAGRGFKILAIRVNLS